MPASAFVIGSAAERTIPTATTQQCRRSRRVPRVVDTADEGSCRELGLSTRSALDCEATLESIAAVYEIVGFGEDVGLTISSDLENDGDVRRDLAWEPET